MTRPIQIISFLMLTLLLGASIFYTMSETKVDTASTRVAQAYNDRYQTYLLADEFRQSSEDLTRFARLVSSTGNPQFMEYYNGILEIRAGKRPRPVDYHLPYWDQVVAGAVASPDSNITAPLRQLMLDSGFTDEEFALMDRAIKQSEHLAVMETEAMNAALGIFKDAQGGYSLRGEPSLDLAESIVYSAEYSAHKSDITASISEFYEVLMERVETEVEAAYAEKAAAEARAQTALIILVVTVFAFGLFLILMCINPLRKLTQAMQELASGATDTEVPCQKARSEFGILARQIQNYKANSDQVAELGEAAKQSEREAMAQHESALALQAEVEKTVSSALAGDFTARIEVEDDDEASREISDSVNTLMGRLDAATAEIVKALAALGDGNVETMLTLEGGGRFQELEDTGETARKRLGEFLAQTEENAERERINNADMRRRQQISARLQEEIDTLISEAQNGQFEKRIEIADADESTARIADGMNNLMSRYDQTIQELISQFQALGEGNLSRQLSLSSEEGRFGDLKETAESARALLVDLISNVSQSAEDLQEAVNRLRADANTVSGSMQNQAASIEETSAATTEMTKAIKENAVSLGDASQLANTVDESASAGTDTMSSVVAAVEEIKHRSDKITDFVSIIENISFQTNLLALNATVEAARAGDAGRGFAVVASEVRNLSLRASDAATDIAGLISATTESVDEGVNLAHQAGATLTAISEDIGKLRERITAVSSSGRDQATTFQEVELAISEISKTTQTTASSAEHSAELSDNLVDTASVLRDTLSRFTTATAANRGRTNVA